MYKQQSSSSSISANMPLNSSNYSSNTSATGQQKPVMTNNFFIGNKSAISERSNKDIQDKQKAVFSFLEAQQYPDNLAKVIYQQKSRSPTHTQSQNSFANKNPKE